MEVEPEAGIRQWGPADWWRPKGEAVKCSLGRRSAAGTCFLPTLFCLHVALLWQECGCGLTWMDRAESRGAATQKLSLRSGPGWCGLGRVQEESSFS